MSIGHVKGVKSLAITLAFLLATGLLTGCGGGDEPEEESPSVYRTLTIGRQDFTITFKLAAMIEAEQPVEIRPQIEGRIAQICVKEGARVAKGQPLVILEQGPYKAAVESAQARVGSAEAQLATARQTLEGKEQLHREHVVGDFDLNKTRNEVAEAEAALAEAKAELASALAQLEYTIIRSPADGQLSMIEYRVGEMVDPSIELEIATVSDPRRIVAYMGLSENALHQLASYFQCNVESLSDHLPEVTLTSFWGDTLESKGRVDAISGNVEKNTGSVAVRASFDNPSRIFLNGSNGIVLFPFPIRDALVISQEATFEIQDKVFVYKVVDGVARQTVVEVLPNNDGLSYVVSSGLEEGDVIIAEGAAFVKDGTRVKVDDK